MAAEIAIELKAPLDILLVRKLGAPFQPELAMGAIGEDGIRVLDDAMVGRLRISQRRINAVEVRERQANVLDLHLGNRRIHCAGYGP